MKNTSYASLPGFSGLPNSSLLQFYSNLVTVEAESSATVGNGILYTRVFKVVEIDFMIIFTLYLLLRH